MNTETNLDQLLRAYDAGTIVIPDSWAQGRTAYGGITAALLCHASTKHIDPARRLRNIEVSFLRPLETLKPFDIEVEILANGKTVTMTSARLMQEGKLRAMAKADFVASLEASVEIDNFQPPAIKPRSECLSMKLDFLPAFISHFDNHLATEALPFSNSRTPELGGWIKFDEPISALTDAHLLCLIDSWPPTAAPYYDGFKPLSTISWGVHFAEPVHSISPDAHLGYLSKVNFGKDGLSSSDAVIWGPNGELLARSFQTNIIYG